MKNILLYGSGILKKYYQKKNRDVSVVSGAAQADIVEWKPEKRLITVKALTLPPSGFQYFYYPGWEAELNNKKIEIKIEDKSDAMLIDIPEGEHTLVLRFKDTPIRYYSKIILLAFFVLFCLSFKGKKDDIIHA